MTTYLPEHIVYQVIENWGISSDVQFCLDMQVREVDILTSIQREEGDT